MTNAISKLTIKGYKSIRNLENFELRNINILIGPNGSGKSNFLGFFELLQAISKEKGLPKFYVERKGGADRFLYLGPKVTQSIKFELIIDSLPQYTNELFLTVNNFSASAQIIMGGWDNSNFKVQDVEELFTSFTFYHFHDTSDLAGVKRPNSEGNFDYLFPDASNLAPFLFRLQNKQPRNYQNIIDVIRLAAPFFDNFKFDINEQNGDVKWWWSQKGSDYQFHPSQISDGTLRFICLATALLQPNPPSTILIDEPELGLHPYALTLLAGLIQKASHRTQVIVSTQSASLVDQFQPEDIVVVERQNGESIFKRLNKDDLKVWLEDYSLGELWEMNMFGGRPSHE
jgi:predicted ATPase